MSIYGKGGSGGGSSKAKSTPKRGLRGLASRAGSAIRRFFGR